MGIDDTQLMFPIHAIDQLFGVRGPVWDDLLELTKKSAPTSCEVIGFVLMMTVQCGCITCNSNSYRGMKGCIECSRLAIRRFKGDDDKLVAIHARYVKDVKNKMRN